MGSFFLKEGGQKKEEISEKNALWSKVSTCSNKTTATEEQQNPHSGSKQGWYMMLDVIIIRMYYF